MDLKEVTDVDFVKIAILSVVFIILILGITFKSISVPILTIFIIEVGIWMNIGIAYFAGEKMSFISYIIVGAIQLGATIDYAILFISRYKTCLLEYEPREAAKEAIKLSLKSIMVSGSILIVATFSVYFIASIKTTSEMCLLIGRGAILSMIGVIFVLPNFLVAFNKIIQKTTYKWPRINTSKK